MTELEELLLAEVTKLEDGMNSLSEQLTAINERLDASTTLIGKVQDNLTNFSEKQQKLLSVLVKLQPHFTNK